MQSVIKERTTVSRTLILGVGNLLMGDEGVGVHTIRMLEREILPKNVHLLDGGTGGFHLISLFTEYDPIIIIDATMDGKASGTVTLTHPKFASDFPRTLSAHDIGLRDLLESAQLLGPLPQLHLITISIPKVQPMTLELSDDVANAMPDAALEVRKLLQDAT
jgi:hydrogenase maturation protease